MIDNNDNDDCSQWWNIHIVIMITIMMGCMIDDNKEGGVRGVPILQYRTKKYSNTEYRTKRWRNTEYRNTKFTLCVFSYMFQN